MIDTSKMKEVLAPVMPAAEAPCEECVDGCACEGEDCACPETCSCCYPEPEEIDAPAEEGADPLADAEGAEPDELDEDADIELAAGYDPERDGDPPAWAPDAEKWTAAKDEVGSDDWAAVIAAYRRLGGVVKED